MTKKNNSLFIYILIGILLGTILKLFVFDIFTVSGTSMEPTLKDNSVVIVNKLSYGLVIPFKYNFFFTWNKPQANDIVIFLHDNKIVIKRCVATSGQQLDFLDDTEYSLIVGNKKIILTEEQFSKMKQFDKVPEGYILAIGDNYYNSVDSRSYGFISEKNVIGKIITNE